MYEIFEYKNKKSNLNDLSPKKWNTVSPLEDARIPRLN